MNRRLCLLAAALAAFLAMSPVAAQSGYPVKTIRLIVPTPAGGPSDAAARLLAQAISKPLGQNIVIENRPGASGAIAA